MGLSVTKMTVPSLTIEHALAIALIVVYPAWDLYDTRELKKGTDPREKLRYYKKTIVLEWVAAVVAIWAVGPQIFLLQAGPPRFAAAHGFAYRLAAWALALLMVWVVLSPHLRALRSVKTRQAVRKAVASLDFFLPRTREEIHGYVALSITAGFCEEILFRGFLLRYLGLDPWRLGLWVAVIAASVVFGAAHLYQGLNGFVNTMIGGLIFSALFLLTGNLVLPIFLHAVADYLLVPVLQGSREGDPKAA